MQKDQLLDLRAKIVQSTQRLVLTTDGPAEERLQVLMNIIRDGEPTIEVLSKAFELSEQLETDEDKLATLLELQYEVDSRLGSLESASPEVDSSAEPTPQPNKPQDA